MHNEPLSQSMRETDIARQIGVSRTTLWRWRRDGKGPRFTRVGERSPRYTRDDFNAWMASLPTGGARS